MSFIAGVPDELADELVAENLDLVGEVLRQLLKSWGWAEPYRDDLEGAGALGLVLAARTWPGTGNFRGWARNKILWKMQQEAHMYADTKKTPNGENWREPRDFLSLDEGEPNALGDVLPDPTDFSDAVFRDVQRGRLREILRDNLTDSEYVTLSRVFGLENGDPMTYTEAADIEGCSRQALTKRVKATLARIAEVMPELCLFLEE